MNITFSSQEECLNSTQNCFHNGQCLKNNGDWLCFCKLFYDYHFNCEVDIRDSVWQGRDLYFYVIGLVLSTLLLLLFLMEWRLQYKHQKHIKLNEMTIVRCVFVLYILMRIIDYSLGTTIYITKSYLTYDFIANFFIFFPYVLSVLSYQLCVVVWYNLILVTTLKNNKYNLLGKNIFLGMSVVYSIGALVLIILVGIDISIFLNVVVYWILIPLVGSILHCFIQVYRVNSLLKDKTIEPSKALKKLKKKNKILGLLSQFLTIIVLLTIALNVIEYQIQV
eukprot:TRINITY_DN19767_c0_g2_i1.p1 TRINITY_DN19767_c0_g2~~TRINITY_DN19767_c0_g2_i1.p1  ORF type:complete len:279 (-),score=34.84 TRINITY_DN19767_c0_g2_i1:4-840(-)